MPTPQLYPYKLRVQFTKAEERGLKAAADRRKRAITEVIRLYVDAGLAADGLADLPAEPLPGQTTIDTPEETP
jgi:hypothetical protein